MDDARAYAGIDAMTVGAARTTDFFSIMRRAITRDTVQAQPPALIADVACSKGAASCMGAPSIVGLPGSLHELARVVKPGGLVVVSNTLLTTCSEDPENELPSPPTTSPPSAAPPSKPAPTATPPPNSKPPSPGTGRPPRPGSATSPSSPAAPDSGPRGRRDRHPRWRPPTVPTDLSLYRGH